MHTQGRGKWIVTHKGTPQLHSKTMVTFKGEWGKLYYTQHTVIVGNTQECKLTYKTRDKWVINCIKFNCYQKR